jgi:predicted PurR-regulated permease PerM
MDKNFADRSQRIARTLLVVGLLLLGLWIAGPFVPALLWAVVVAVAVDPLHVRLRERMKGAHRMILPLAITGVVALAVLIPLGFGVAQAAREAHDIGLWIATAQTTGLPVPDWLGRLPIGSEAAQTWWQANLATPGFRAGEWIAQSRAIGSGLIHRAVIFGFTLLTLFFVLRDRDSLIAQARKGADKWLGEAGERIGEQALRSVRGTIDGLVLVGLGVGAIMAVAYFALGVPHPLMLGALTAVAAMIPFGAPLVFVLAALLLVVAGSPGAAIAVVVIGTVVMFVADHFIRPALIGGATRLPFLWVLIGILGGVETLGLLGLFIGPAAMAVLVMLWREFLAGGLPPLEQPAEDPADQPAH